MLHDEHVLILALCETPPESSGRQAIYDQLRLARAPDAIAATMYNFANRRRFVTTSDWRNAELTAAGRDRLLAERAILLTRTP